MDQPGGSGSRAFVLLVGERSLELPGPPLAANGGAAGLQGPDRQWAVGGGIEVADIAGNIELGTLRWEHLDGLFGGRTSIMADLDHASHSSIAPSARR